MTLRLQGAQQHSECKKASRRRTLTPHRQRQLPRPLNDPQQTRMPFWPPLHSVHAKRPPLAGAVDGAVADVGAAEAPQLPPMTFRRRTRSRPPPGAGKPMQLPKLACGTASRP